MDNIKISILLPNYNGGSFINKCLDSIVGQTYANWEVIIVDANSSDDSHQKIQSYCRQDSRFKHVVDIEDKSLSDAINIGIKNATGDYAIWLGSDDFFNDNSVFNDFVSYISDYNKLHGLKAVICYGGYIVHWKQKNIYENKRRTNLDYYLLPFTNIFMCGNVFFDPNFCKSNYITLPSSLKFSMDYDLWMQMYVRIRSRKYITCLPERYIYVFMMRSDNITGGSLQKSNIECRDVALGYAKKKPFVKLIIYCVYYFQLSYQLGRNLWLKFH
jgi:glycosyltransferase involved in cell wall biosynthesis